MKKTSKNMNTGIGMGMCFGVAIGSALGAAFDNISIGVALGISIGLAIGAVAGSQKDKAVNEQIEEKGYTVIAIVPGTDKNYIVTIEDKAGEKKEIIVPAGIMSTEVFSIGDVVFLDEDGMIEQAFDDEDE